MFVQSARFVEHHAGSINNLSVFGQDSNPTTWKLCRMNLAIRGIEANLGETAADTFFNDLHKTEKMDFILANPPFNLSGWGADKLLTDVRWKYGLPPAGNANFAWLQHMIFHLSAKGRMGMVLANGSLSSQTGGEGAIRQAIVEDDLVECIIAMPAQLFYTTQIPVSLWFLNKKKPRKGQTLFIDARNKGTLVNRRLREMTDPDIAAIAEAVERFREGKLKPHKGFYAAATTEEIAKQDYILTPGRYVGLAEETADGEPFDEKMTRLTAELSGLFSESRKLEKEIRKRLGAIGYEV
jgi:type I restriction enzyme M protein